jgi:hypothetical protein
VTPPFDAAAHTVVDHLVAQARHEPGALRAAVRSPSTAATRVGDLAAGTLGRGDAGDGRALQAAQTADQRSVHGAVRSRLGAPVSPCVRSPSV